MEVMAAFTRFALALLRRPPHNFVPLKFIFHPVCGFDPVEKLYHPIQCLLLQFFIYRDFGKLNPDQQEWGEWHLHVGHCWRTWLPDSADHGLSDMGKSEGF
jgi:hypothetical protein